MYVIRKQSLSVFQETTILDLERMVFLVLIPVIQYAYNRYSETFGTLNTAITVADHSIIALDTVSLSGRSDSPSFKNAQAFMDKLNSTREKDPTTRVLISHVPLFRPEDADCGPRRTTTPIRNLQGYQYQSI